MHWTEVWFGEGFAPQLVRTLLTPASWAYALGWRAYQSVYDIGIKKAARPHRPIVCVGNLTVGGTGKTPMTVFLVQALGELGREVAIGCSGYGSPASEKASLAPSGGLKAAQWGDEAALLRVLLPDTPLIVGRGRVVAAELCEKHFPNSVLLMDDGLQHLPLGKDVAIILDPPVSNRRCLPAGPYRQPHTRAFPGSLKIPGDFQMTPAPLTFVVGVSSEQVPPPPEAHVLCAIGYPQGLLDGVRQAGVKIKTARLLSDHSPLTDGNLFDELPPGDPIIVTLKDWVKLRERTDLGARHILVAQHRVNVEPRAEFIDWIRQRLNEVDSKGT